MESTYKYQTKCGHIAIFDILKTKSIFGVEVGDRFETPRGNATVIGLGYDWGWKPQLWFHVDGDRFYFFLKLILEVHHFGII